jgi:hypothetical protein
MRCLHHIPPRQVAEVCGSDQIVWRPERSWLRRTHTQYICQYLPPVSLYKYQTRNVLRRNPGLRQRFCVRRRSWHWIWVSVNKLVDCHGTLPLPRAARGGKSPTHRQRYGTPWLFLPCFRVSCWTCSRMSDLLPVRHAFFRSESRNPKHSTETCSRSTCTSRLVVPQRLFQSVCPSPNLLTGPERVPLPSKNPTLLRT